MAGKRAQVTNIVHGMKCLCSSGEDRILIYRQTCMNTITTKMRVRTQEAMCSQLLHAWSDAASRLGYTPVERAFARSTAVEELQVALHRHQSPLSGTCHLRSDPVTTLAHVLAHSIQAMRRLLQEFWA